MKTAIRWDEMEVLGHRLQTQVQMQFPLRIPLQVKCAIRQQTLIILAQHAYEVSPNPWRTFEVFEQTVRQSCSDHLIRLAIAPPKTLAVRFYLRIAGEHEPYAADGFDLEPFQVETLNKVQQAEISGTKPQNAAMLSLPAVSIAHSEASSAKLANADLSDEHTETEVAAEEAAEADKLVLAAAEEAQSLEPPEVTETVSLKTDSVSLKTDSKIANLSTSQKPVSRLPLQMMGMAAAGLFALTSSLYALTRPCVIGACVPLQTAQQLSQEAAQLVRANSSAMEVSEAYQKLAEGSYLLGTIPRWSGEYAEAQALLQVYGTQSEALEQVVTALQTANEAAHASQNPPHPLTQWEGIRAMWEEAIALLEQVSANHPIHPLAQQKLTEYQANLSMINQRIVIEQQAQDKIQLARDTARLAEARESVAESVEGWQLAHVTWQVVVNLLQEIPSGTMARAEAEQLLAIYQPRLEGARDRRLQEEISSKAYNQALTMAEAARQLEQQNQWSQAVSQWRSALANAQQIPTGTSYHGQIQPLVNSYSTSLSEAQETLRSAVAMGNAQAQLEQTCASSIRICTFTLSDKEIQVRITPDYDQAIEQAIANGQATGNPNVQAEATAHSNALLRALANISESTQVPIELYNADGSLFGTYVPELSGYVPRQASS
jgi:gas vesicle protein